MITTEFDMGFLADIVPHMPLIAFFVSLIIFAVYSVVLIYHWLKYEIPRPILVILIPVYLGVSAILIGVMYISALALNT